MWRPSATLGACAAILLVAVAPAAAAGVNQDPNQTYVSMGDSYSAGNGAGQYYEESCFRSNDAYGPLINPDIPGSFSHPACSGARTPHISTSSQNGFPPQADLLGSATQYVSVSIGGNDAGFTDALTACANPFSDCNAAIDDAESKIQNELPAKLDAAYARIRQRAPNATVTVVGYPRIFKPNSTCNVVFSSGEVNQANAAADLLAEVTRERALAAGFSFADARPAFLGHGACDNEWINGFSISDTSGSFHPNDSGYRGYAGIVRATLLAARHPGETPGPNGRLAFTSGRDGNSEIYAMNGNGDFPVNVSNDAAADVDPAWSPDGTKLAFTSDRDGDNEIYVLDWASKSLTQLTVNAADDGEPAWSPNGDLIAFRSNRDGDNDIWKMTATGGSPTDLTSFSSDSNNDTAPAWSPDGSEIAFRRASGGGNGEVFRMSSDGQGHTNLTNNSADDGAPAWSPDGRTIAFHSARDGNYEIYTMTRGGASVTRRTTNTVDDKDPTYAPSGSGIAFASKRDGNDEIYTATATGGSPVRRTSVSQADVAPTWQGDGTPPETTIQSGPQDPVPTSLRQPQFAFTSDEFGSSFQCRVDGGAWGSCATPFNTASLGNGQHSFEVRATDPSGNADPSPAMRLFTVNPTSGTSITDGPAGITASRTPEFAFESTVAGTTFECSVDGAPFAACEPPFSTPELGDGPHTFAVRGIAPGNQVGEPVTSAFTVDATEPETTIDFEPPAAGSDPRPSFEFSSSEPGSSFECRLDSAAPGDWVSCSSPFDPGSLADGQHTFDVRAVDGAGNRDAAPEHREFEIDTAAPTTTIEALPPRMTTAVVDVTFAAGEPATYECRFDSADEADWETCTSPASSPSLADGPHTFDVRATDVAGNVEPAPARTDFVVDATPPDTFIDSAPHGLTNQRKPAFTFSSDDLDPDFQCQVDDGPWLPCAQEFVSPTSLGDDSHTFRVRAVDAFGNLDPNPATETFTVDGTPPAKSEISGPSVTNDMTPTFDLTGDELLQCRLDAPGPSSPWSSCSSPFTAPTLAAGAHRLEVRALDAAGNTSDPRAWDFTVDLTAPAVINLVKDVPNLTRSRAATIRFASPEPGADFECQFDSRAWEQCSSPWALTRLADGTHTARVVAIDAVGNRTTPPATTSFTVDNTPPDTTITAGPSGPTLESRPVFRFSAGEQATHECRIDGGDWRSCVSGDSFGPLADGAHTFEVRGIDRVPNVETTPASRSFAVDTQVAAPVAAVPAKLRVRGAVSIPVAVSAGEATDASASGTVAAGSAKVALPPKAIALQSRARGALKLAPAKSGAKVLKRALAKRKPLKATVTVRFEDALGNATTLTRTVKLAGKR